MQFRVYTPNQAFEPNTKPDWQNIQKGKKKKTEPSGRYERSAMTQTLAPKMWATLRNVRLETSKFWNPFWKENAACDCGGHGEGGGAGQSDTTKLKFKMVVILEKNYTGFSISHQNMAGGLDRRIGMRRTNTVEK